VIGGPSGSSFAEETITGGGKEAALVIWGATACELQADRPSTMSGEAIERMTARLIDG
jgi:hypothetical protein